ncbi:hypothetical protein JOQ06_029739, partial [Pogonophryne albipinna]
MAWPRVCGLTPALLWPRKTPTAPHPRPQDTPSRTDQKQSNTAAGAQKPPSRSPEGPYSSQTTSSLMMPRPNSVA